LKNSKVVSFLSPFKVGQAGNLWTLPRRCLLDESCPQHNNVPCCTQIHSVAKHLPTRHVTNVLPRLKLLSAMTTFTPLAVFLIKSFTTKKSIYMEPVQGWNLNRRYISGFEPEMPVTHRTNDFPTQY